MKRNKFLFKTTCIKKVVTIPRKIPVIKSLVSVIISVTINIAACSLPIFRILRKLLGAASLYPVYTNIAANAGRAILCICPEQKNETQ